MLTGKFENSDFSDFMRFLWFEFTETENNSIFII